jgi:hypothetical protein
VRAARSEAVAAPNANDIPKDYDPANPYAWHDAAMKGDRGPIHAEEPQTGWYRNRRIVSEKGETPKRYEFEAVAYWRDTKTGEQRCHINGKAPSENAMYQAWPYASKYPISEETYHAYLATGQWPEHNDVLAEQERRSNEAPDDDSLEGVQARIDALVAEARRYMKKGAAKTKAEADAAADVSVKLGELYTHADKQRDKEKRPHLEAGREVDAKWNPVRDAALIYKDLKAEVVNPWLNAEKARLQKIADDAAEEQRKIRQKAIDAAAAKQKEIDDAHAAAAAKAAAANKPAPPPPAQVEVVMPEAAYAPAPIVAPVRVGTGKTISSRIERTAFIEDYAKALAHFAGHEEVKALVQALANKLAKAKMPIPGCKIMENGKAV